MILKNFVKDAVLTESNDFKSIHGRMEPKNNIRLLHASIGMMTELTELVENLQKTKFDSVNFLEENADLLWYIAIACDALDLDFEKMILEAYQKTDKKKVNILKYNVIRKLKFKSLVQDQINKAIIASGNCTDVMKKTLFYDNKSFNQEKFILNLNNLCLAIANMLFLISSDVEYACERVIHKLQKVRYKLGKFTASEALERNIADERKSLENK